MNDMNATCEAFAMRAVEPIMKTCTIPAHELELGDEVWHPWGKQWVPIIGVQKSEEVSTVWFKTTIWSEVKGRRDTLLIRRLSHQS